MEAKFESGAQFLGILRSLKELSGEVNFDVSAEGITIEQMDSGATGLIAMCIRPDFFEHFNCEKNHPIGLNLESVIKVLKSVKDSTLTLKTYLGKEDSEPERMEIYLESDDIVKKYDIKLMLIDCQRLKPQDKDEDYTIHLRLSPVTWFSVLNDATATGGDTIHFDITPERVVLSSSADIGDASITIQNSEKSLTITGKGRIRLEFSAPMLKRIKPPFPMDNIKISFIQDRPVKLSFPMGVNGAMDFYLAPRIAND